MLVMNLTLAPTLKRLSMDAYIAARMTKASDGAFEAMMEMGKIDVAKIEAARRG